MTQDGVPNTQRTAKIFFIFSPGVTLYSGIALSLAWVNAMWFVPPLYSFTELLAEDCLLYTSDAADEGGIV